MEDETFVSEPNALNESPVVDSQDEFASIREHFEAGIQLTDAEMNKIADTAVFYLRELLPSLVRIAVQLMSTTVKMVNSFLT